MIDYGLMIVCSLVGLMVFVLMMTVFKPAEYKYFTAKERREIADETKRIAALRISQGRYYSHDLSTAMFGAKEEAVKAAFARKYGKEGPNK